MDEYGRGSRKKKGLGLKGKLILALAVIVIILVAGFAYYFLGAPIAVSGPTTITLNSKGAVFAMDGKNYVATLAGFNNNTQTAYIYISSVPVFLGPVLNVTLHQNATVKVNYNSQYAVMQVRLISGNKNTVSVQISPLAASLQVDPDYQYIGHPTATISGLQINVSTTTIAAPMLGSGGENTSSVTTTVKTTTTVQATNYTAQAVMAAANADLNYGLMLNFTALYNQTPSCTASMYKLSYFDRFGSFPVPPMDYYNVSYETPYGMTHKTVSKGGNSYAVEFLPLVQDTAFNGTVALEIDVTVTSPGTGSAIGMVSADKYGGIFKGATYDTLSTQYSESKSVNNACAAMVG